MYSKDLGIDEKTFWRQVNKAVESANTQFDTSKRMDKLEERFDAHCEKQEQTFSDVSKKFDYIKENMATMPKVKQYVDEHYNRKKKDELEEENRELKDALKVKPEHSQQFFVGEHPTPQDGVAVAKTPLYRNPYIMAPTIGTGTAAFIYAVVDLIIKMNTGG